MFTGIIETIGTVKTIARGAVSSSLEIHASNFLEDTQLGDSIAVNGVCLTVTQMTRVSFCADAVAETLRQTNLGQLREGHAVNLEKALNLQKRMGGHIVSGHVDGTGQLKSMVVEDKAVWLEVSVSEDMVRYIIGRGSITVDGVSLTAAIVGLNSFKVSIIPHTGQETTLLSKKVGDMLNIECDILGKYVEKLLGFPKKSNIDLDFLKNNGF